LWIGGLVETTKTLVRGGWGTVGWLTGLENESPITFLYFFPFFSFAHNVYKTQ
jgi:hypothetical protein